MSVTLPARNEQRDTFRILTAPSWGDGNATWTVQPMASSTRAPGGFELLFCSRVALPAVGEARIRYRFGRIDGTIVGVSGTPASAAWDPSTSTAVAPDLTGFEIRIQAAPKVAQGSTPAWRTIWWGQCEYMQDTDMPGSSIPLGERIYHCVDGFFRTNRWPMNRHGYYTTESVNGISSTNSEEITMDNVAGHPGYNFQDGSGITRGNKDATSAGYYLHGGGVTPFSGGADDKIYYHTWQASSTAVAAFWSDKEQIEHAVRITRPKGDPVFSLYGSTTLYTQTGAKGGNAREVSETQSAWEFVSDVCRRQRGRGLVFVDWADDVASPTRELSVRLTVRPQVLSNITYSVYTAGSAVPTLYTINGATTDGTYTTVDLIGDHRNVASDFIIGAREYARYDYIESRGERIQILATLSYFDGTVSLNKRWAAKMETDFAALSLIKRVDEAWKPVWQLHGLPHAWNGLNGGHNNSAQARIDYRCDDTGQVVVLSASDKPDTSPLLVRILPDIPMLEGYDYTAEVPVRKDAATEAGTPPRRPPFILLRTSADHYLFGEEATRPVTLNVSRDGIYVYAPADVDDSGATRVIGKMTTVGLGSDYDINQLGITVGLELPHRVRKGTKALDDEGHQIPDDSVRRRLVIPHPDLHLWLAPSITVWDLNTNSRDSTTGSLARRSACGGTANAPGALRDDRNALSQLHALAESWYLLSRKTATWSLKACGFLPSFEYADGNLEPSGSTDYPTLGQLVTTLSAGGQNHTLNTPITSVMYDNESGITTWATDWGQLDFMS